MSEIIVPPPVAPDHIEQTIRSIAQLRADHHENATSLQRTVDRMTTLLSRPWLIGVITVIVVSWISLNLLAATLGARPIDPPPFAWLGGAVSLISLYMVVLILATQRREDQLAQRRELLILELAILAEQKTAKVIQLLEESPPRQSVYSQSGRSGSRGHGSTRRSKIRAGRDHGNSRGDSAIAVLGRSVFIRPGTVSSAALRRYAFSLLKHFARRHRELLRFNSDTPRRCRSMPRSARQIVVPRAGCHNRKWQFARYLDGQLQPRVATACIRGGINANTTFST